jgi:hypothetical protein
MPTIGIQDLSDHMNIPLTCRLATSKIHRTEIYVAVSFQDSVDKSLSLQSNSLSVSKFKSQMDAKTKEETVHVQRTDLFKQSRTLPNTDFYRCISLLGTLLAMSNESVHFSQASHWLLPCLVQIHLSLATPTYVGSYSVPRM